MAIGIGIWILASGIGGNSGPSDQQIEHGRTFIRILCGTGPDGRVYYVGWEQADGDLLLKYSDVASGNDGVIWKYYTTIEGNSSCS
jgi:hypothetical protein